MATPPRISATSAPGIPAEVSAMLVMAGAARREVGEADTDVIDTTAAQTTGQTLDPPALAAEATATIPASVATDLSVVTTINIGGNPFGAVITTDGTRLYVTNADGTVSVIDTATNTTVGEPISVGPIGFGAAVSPDGTRLYVGGLDDELNATVSVIDTASYTTVGDPIPVGGSALRRLEVNRDGTRLFVVTTGYDDVSQSQVYSLAVINTSTGTLVGDPISIGGDNVFGLAFSPDGGRLYASSAVADDEGAADTYSILVIDTATGALIGDPISLGDSGPGLAVSPDGTRLYATTTGDADTVGTVSVIDTATNSVIKVIPVGHGAFGVAVSPDGKRVYVTSLGNVWGGGPGDVQGTMAVIDTRTNKVVGDPIPVGVNPTWPVVSPDGSRAYVTNYIGGTVSVIDTGFEPDGPQDFFSVLREWVTSVVNGIRMWITNAVSSISTFVVDAITRLVSALSPGAAQAGGPPQRL